MKRFATIAAVTAIALLGLSSPGASKAKPPVRHDKLPLHLGSHGPRVVQLQELLAGGHGNVFRKIKPTYKGKPNGLLGEKTELALFAYKYRLGYPGKFNIKAHPIAGADLFNLLTGKTKRTLVMVALAQQRLQAVEAGMTDLAFSIKKLELAALGAHEQPDGSNCGPEIDKYFAYFHISCGLPWCEIAQQYFFAKGGYSPPFANRSFLVTYTADWARQHGYLNAKAKPGALVAFLDDGGHIGYVTHVYSAGYVTIEANSSNRVAQVFHPWNARLRVFIWLPGVT